MQDENAQPIGELVPNWTPRPHPLSDPNCHTFQGQYCRLELLNSKTNETIIEQLFRAFKPTENTHFTYLGYGPFETVEELKDFVRDKEKPSSETVLYSILVNEEAVGFITYLRINPDQGVIEIGHINFSERLVRTRQATEAIYLLMECAFDTLAYRRVEWKCNALNSKSRQAALRLGFQYEGTFVKAEVCKGRSRDNAWFSIVDDEWPPVKQELQRWLKPENFDVNGQQLSKLNGAQVNSRSTKIVEVKQRKHSSE